MSWTAVVPIKVTTERKSRLAGNLSPEARIRLSETLLSHTLNVLQQTPGIGRIVLLSQKPRDGWTGQWVADQGRGLNEELRHVAELYCENLLILHADLPAVSSDDIAALIERGARGIAIAPDRHATGTNAIALARAEQFPFAFGPYSFARHQALAGGQAQIVTRPGLALDIDTPEDLALAEALTGLALRIPAT